MVIPLQRSYAAIVVSYEEPQSWRGRGFAGSVGQASHVPQLNTSLVGGTGSDRMGLKQQQRGEWVKTTTTSVRSEWVKTTTTNVRK